jgi:hypothetical protein
VGHVVGGAEVQDDEVGLVLADEGQGLVEELAREALLVPQGEIDGCPRIPWRPAPPP